MSEKLPQRFRYRPRPEGPWLFGICWPCYGEWIARTEQGGLIGIHVDHEPLERIRRIIGDCSAFEWIDNDFGWSGDLMKRDPEVPVLADNCKPLHIVEILGPTGKVHYRRPHDHKDVAESLRSHDYSVLFPGMCNIGMAEKLLGVDPAVNPIEITTDGTRVLSGKRS